MCPSPPAAAGCIPSEQLEFRVVIIRPNIDEKLPLLGQIIRQPNGGDNDLGFRTCFRVLEAVVTEIQPARGVCQVLVELVGKTQAGAMRPVVGKVLFELSRLKILAGVTVVKVRSGDFVQGIVQRCSVILDLPGNRAQDQAGCRHVTVGPGVFRVGGIDRGAESRCELVAEPANVVLIGGIEVLFIRVDQSFHDGRQEQISPFGLVEKL